LNQCELAYGVLQWELSQRELVVELPRLFYQHIGSWIEEPNECFHAVEPRPCDYRQNKIEARRSAWLHYGQ
jgi:hypothetical protein